MGTLETTARRKRRLGYVQKAILTTIGMTGILAVTLLAPNVLQIIPRIMGNKYKFAHRARTAAGRLAAQGYVRFIERKGMKYVEITERGRQVLSFEIQKMSLLTNIKKRWDGCWRMVIFDIPERKRNIRVQLRTTMEGLGFLRLQNRS